MPGEVLLAGGNLDLSVGSAVTLLASAFASGGIAPSGARTCISRALPWLGPKVRRGYRGLSQPTWVYPRILDICWIRSRCETPNYLFYMASPTGFEPVLPP